MPLAMLFGARRVPCCEFCIAGDSSGSGTIAWPQRQLDRRLEEAAEAVGGVYRRSQMPLKLALALRGTVAGHRLGPLEGGGGGGLPRF